MYIYIQYITFIIIYSNLLFFKAHLKTFLCNDHFSTTNS